MLSVTGVTCQDGDVEFVFVGGNLALDFAGTLKWRDDECDERLRCPDDLARWAVEAGVLTEHATITEAELGRARELREAVYRLVVATLDGNRWPARHVGLLNAHAALAPPRVALSRDTRTVIRRGAGDAIGWAVANAAIDLLGADLPVRECARDRCTRLFVDRSRTGNRRWCGMVECGNRIKAAEYRARHAGRT